MKKTAILGVIILIIIFCIFSYFHAKKNANTTIIQNLTKDNSHLIIYIKDEYTNILFDTGNAKKRLFKCLKDNNLNIRQIDYIIISHKHLDHIGGMLKIKHNELYEKTKIAINNNIYNQTSEKFQKMLSAKKFNLVRPAHDYIISKNVIYTNSLLGIAETYGKQWEVQESFLIIKKHNKLTIISGCAHPGIIEMVEYAKKITGCDKINAVVGGLGVIGEKEAQYLNNTKADIYPIHCTEYKEGSLLKVKTMPVVIR